MYERLLGRCRVCAMIDHGGLCCPRTVEEETVHVSQPTASTVSEMVFRTASSASGSSMFQVPPLKKPEKGRYQFVGLEKSLAGVQLTDGSGSKKRVRPRGSHNKTKLDAPKDTEVPEVEED
ncbi:hypothetical protein ACLB2K_035171 [Fragaria x ananassa]